MLEEGTYTIVAIDIPEAPRQLEIDPGVTRSAVLQANRLAEAIFSPQGGIILQELDVESSLIALFRHAKNGVDACCEFLCAARAEEWHPNRDLIRAAIATGDLCAVGEELDGPALVTVHALRQILNVGQVGVAESTKAVVRDTIAQPASLTSLGTHHLDDSSGAQMLFQLVHPDLPQTFKELASLLSFPSNLPRETTPFVGRLAEIEQIREKFFAAPAVVIVGIGGVGKTRIALEVARDMMEQHYHSACYIDLSRVSGPTGVISAFASALEIPEGEGEGLARITDHLAGKEILLVIDNCENVSEHVAAAVTQILRHCYHVQLLLTSRRPLSIPNSATYRLRPMGIPLEEEREDPDSLEQVDAVRLFNHRASADTDFVFDNTTAPLVADIVRSLEGIPLAIEVAAARVRHRGLTRVHEELRDRFESLDDVEESGTHRTLTRALAWSYDLLDDAAQTLFRRLSIFHGTFSEEAAEGICEGDPVAKEEIHEILDSLNELGLVEREVKKGYWRLLESTRDFGMARLSEEGTVTELGNKHAAWFLQSLEPLLDQQYGAGAQEVFNYIQAVYPNVLAAIDWSLGADDPGDVPFRFIECMYLFWYVRALSQEGITWAERVLEGSPKIEDVQKSRLLNMIGVLATNGGQVALAIKNHERALGIGRKLQNRDVLMASLSSLGAAHHLLGNSEKAYAAHSETLTLCQGANRPEDLQAALANTGIALINLGRYEEAESLLRQAYESATSHNNEYAKLVCHLQLAVIGLKRGIAEGFDHHIGLALRIGVSFGAQRTLCSVLRYCAFHAVEMQLFNKAAIIFGFEKKFRATCGATIPLASVEEYREYLDAARAQLKSRYSQEEAVGARMSLEDIVALATDDLRTELGA